MELQPEWELDALVKFCPTCNKKFNFVTRKHHCRGCGKIFCSHCCSKKMQLPEIGYPYPERVCDECFIERKTRLMGGKSMSKNPIAGRNSLKAQPKQQEKQEPAPVEEEEDDHFILGL